MKAKIAELKEILVAYSKDDFFQKIHLEHELNNISEFFSEIQEFRPQVAVIGEFSTGKSTLINSFIGRPILPAKFRPTTNFITRLNFSNEEYMVLDGERHIVSTEALADIRNIKQDEVYVYLKSEILKDFSLIDTPGTNDPATFRDEIVFDLVGRSDVVIFMMNINQAFKETEREFLSKLLRKRDLSKIFFVLNFAESIENPRIVKNDIIERLSNILLLDKNLVAMHVFLYSAKKALEDTISGSDNRWRSALIDAIKSHIKTSRSEIIETRETNFCTQIVENILNKIEALEAMISNKVDVYEKQLHEIDEKIKLFEENISKELQEVAYQFEKIKVEFANNLKNRGEIIINEISNEIDSVPKEKIAGTRYIELRAKKLLEDSVEEETRDFMRKITYVFQELDSRLLNIDGIRKLIVGAQIGQNLSEGKVAKMKGAIGVAGGLAATVPVAVQGVTAIAGTLGLGGFFSGLGMLKFMPFVGTILGSLSGMGATITAAVPLIAASALAIGKTLYDVGKWSSTKAVEIASSVEVKVIKSRYISHLRKSMEQLISSIIKHIDEVTFDNLKRAYIDAKFPEKKQLQEKVKIIREKKLKVSTLVKEDIDKLNKLKTELQLLIQEV